MNKPMEHRFVGYWPDRMCAGVHMAAVPLFGYVFDLCLPVQGY
jgi:hypothetical protein